MEKKAPSLSAYDNVSSAHRELNELMEETLSTHCHIFTQFLFVQSILRSVMVQLKDAEQTQNSP